MRLIARKLYGTKLQKIIRLTELFLLIFSICFFVYEKATTNSTVYEGQELTVSGENGQYTLGPLSLKKGVYRIYFNGLATEAGSFMGISSQTLNGVRLRSNPCELSTTSNQSYLYADLRGNAKDVILTVTPSGNGIFELDSIDVVKTTDLSKRYFAIAILFLIIGELILWISNQERAIQMVSFVLAGIFLICCYPLMNDYLMESHDILFHMARIEGLAQGLKAGAFPVKIQPLWGDGYGYAVGVFYGDILLYFPAILRLFGFPLQTAFQMYVALIQFGTVIISFVCFKTIFARYNIALIGTALYCFSTYRLQNTYTRAGVGEFTAMMFLPVVVCGFYLILSDGNDTKKLFRKAIFSPLITALGLTGLIGSHILSCEMIAFFIVVTLLICLKKAFRINTFMNLLKALGITILFNLGFIVPFIDYYFQPLNVRSSSWQGASSTGIQEYGISPLQLFSLFGNSTGGSFDTTPGITREVSYSIGFVLVFLLFVFVGLVIFNKEKLRKKETYRTSIVMAALGGLSLWMSTCYFPWNAIASLNSGIFKAIAAIQFPWRFLEFATIFLVIVGCFAIDSIYDLSGRHTFTVFASVVLTLSFINAAWFMNDYVLNTDIYRIYDTYEVTDKAFYSAEYLYEGTDISEMVENRFVCENASVNSFSINGTSITANISSSEGGNIEVPLNYYKHYICKTDNNEKLTVGCGSNNRVNVQIPSGYNGNITVSFKEPFIWRLAEIISVISFIGFVSVGIVRKKIYSEIN